MNAKFKMLLITAITSTSFNLMSASESTGFFFSDLSDQKRAVDLAPMFAPESVKVTIRELESLRPHLNETCIFGAAMLINNLGEQAQNALDEETKCIHNLVIFKQRHDSAELAKVSSD